MATKKPYYDYDRVKHRVSQYHYNIAVQQNLPIEITSYSQALDWWKRRVGLWTNSTDRPVAKSDDYNRRMRMLRDKSIEFEYYQHVLCTWHPDDTLTVDPYKGYRNGFFDQFVMPMTIEVSNGPRVGKIIYLRETVDHTLMVGRRIKQDIVQVEGISGKRNVVDPSVLVIRGTEPVTLKREQGERWAPVNEYRCKPFYWYELDRSELREASKKYNIPEFVNAISMALAMGADIKTSNSYVDVHQRKNESGENILTLLEQERYVEAAGLVRPSVDRRWDSTNNKWVLDTKGLSSLDIKKIRHTAYVEMGLIYLESARVVTLPEYNNIERKLLDFGVPAE